MSRMSRSLVAGCVAAMMVLIYYGASDTRTNVAGDYAWTGSLDYVLNTPPDAMYSAACVRQRIALIEKNLRASEGADMTRPVSGLGCAHRKRVTREHPAVLDQPHSGSRKRRLSRRSRLRLTGGSAGAPRRGDQRRAFCGPSRRQPDSWVTRFTAKRPTGRTATSSTSSGMPNTAASTGCSIARATPSRTANRSMRRRSPRMLWRNTSAPPASRESLDCAKQLFRLIEEHSARPRLEGLPRSTRARLGRARGPCGSAKRI